MKHPNPAILPCRFDPVNGPQYLVTCRRCRESTWRATNICSQKPELPARPCAQYAQVDLVDVVSSKIPSEQQRSHYSRAECSEDVYVLRNELGIFVTIFDTFDFRICQLGETSQSWSTLSTFQVVKLVKLVKVWSF